MDDAPLLIADVPWLLYRAFFSLPKSIKGADGKPVNALLGTVNALLAASEAQPPRAVVACFGAEEARYRVEAYPPYHAHRDAMPAELREQWGRAPELLASFGWTIADAAELEADDAMGSFARVEAAGWRACSVVDRGPRPLSVRRGQRGCFGFGKGRGVLCLGTEPGPRSLWHRARTGARFHCPARRPIRRLARGARDRGEDGG